MSWTEFGLITSGLITLVLLLVAFPWLRRREVRQRDVLSNIEIVRQRLTELEREVSEGLISEADRQKASDELKLAMVDEAGSEATVKKQSALLPLLTGAVLAIATGTIVYASVNHLQQVRQAEAAIESLPELSDKLASGDAGSFTAQDIASLTYAIRQRLRSEPEDATGWMFLGRLWMSVGEDEQALQSIQRALSLKPGDMTIRITYAQALMVSEDAGKLAAARRVLQSLTEENPENDNLSLMMAVVSARLGDLAGTERYFALIRDKLPPQHETRLALEERIAGLKKQQQSVPVAAEQMAAKTGFDITVTIADEIKDKLPDDGYLIVYAQDAQSENRMPAAVVKMQLQNFPVSLSLSTDNAMVPTFTLASLQLVKLTARISTGDDVMPAAGDLSGVLTVPVSPGEVLPLPIQINKELQ